MVSTPKISPLGDRALTIEFGYTISHELNLKAISVARQIETTRFPGFIEAVPAYSSVSVFYNVVEVRNAFAEFPTAFEALKHLVAARLENPDSPSGENNRIVEIPVDFGEAVALDLDSVAEFAKLDRQGVLELFLSRTYRVYMLGFLPGFAYMGTVDERIAIPRHSTPRKAVPRGSVGIAGLQTGIYPLESPGGWQIIGRTSMAMFDPDTNDAPCALRPGDEVRFVHA